MTRKEPRHSFSPGDIIFTGAQYIYLKDGDLDIYSSGKLDGNYSIEVIETWEADMHKSAGAVIHKQDTTIPIHIFP